MSKKDSTKLYVNIALYVLLPIFSILIGYFGVSTIVNNNEPEVPNSSFSAEKKVEESDGLSNVDSNVKEDEDKEDETEAQVITYSREVKLKDFDIYNIQVASFASKENAENHKRELNEKGYPAYIYYENSYRVFILSSVDRDNLVDFKNDFSKDFSDIFISKTQVTSNTFKTNSKNDEILEEIEVQYDRLVQLFAAYGHYVSNLNIDDISKEEFEVFAITQINEMSKSLKVLGNLDTDQDLDRIVDHMINILKGFEDIYSDLSKSSTYDFKALWEDYTVLLYKFSLDN